MPRNTPAVVSLFSVNPTRIGGMETFARELSLQLGQFGWQSVLSTLCPPPEPVAQFLNLPNVHLETCACAHVTLRGVKELAGILGRHRPRILHLHFMGMISPYAWMARLYGADRIYFTDHFSRREGLQPERVPGWKRVTFRLINAPLTNVVAVSDFNRDFLAALDTVPRRKITRIHNSVDVGRVRQIPAAASFRRRFGIPEDRALIVQVSMITPAKGVADLLQAARIVVSQHASCHFVFVGEGGMREGFRRQAVSLGLEDHVTFTGPILDPFEEGVFAAADIVCQVSRWEEAFGWAIVEGMAFEKPVVGTRVGGIPEVIEDGVTGRLAERGNAEQIAGYLLDLLRSPELRQRMGRAGRQAVDAKFHLPTNVARLVELYGIR